MVIMMISILVMTLFGMISNRRFFEDDGDDDDNDYVQEGGGVNLY